MHSQQSPHDADHGGLTDKVVWDDDLQRERPIARSLHLDHSTGSTDAASVPGRPQLISGDARSSLRAMFTISGLLTIVHAVADIDTADAWYERVLGSRRIFRTAHAHAKGAASRHSVADLTIEPISSADPTSNINRVWSRYGERLYSTAWLVDDLGECYRQLVNANVRMTGANGLLLTEAPTSDAIFTHPKDTFGVMEFVLASRHPEEVQPSSDAGLGHLERVIVLVPDAEAAAERYEAAFCAHPIAREEREGEHRSVVVELGAAGLLELRAPWSPESALASVLAHRGDGAYGMRLGARDVRSLRRRFDEAGVRSALSASVLVADPSDCLGVAFEFLPE